VRRGREARKRPPKGWASLTPTELDVVRLACEGLGKKEKEGSGRFCVSLGELVYAQVGKSRAESGIRESRECDGSGSSDSSDRCNTLIRKVLFMGCETGFRHRGIPPGGRLPESVREEFWAALRSGLSPTAAATVAGVSAKTGRLWAKDGGYQTDPKHYGIRYPQATREAFWEAVRSGLTPPQAAVIAGVSEHTGRRWVQQAGCVPRTPVPADVEPDPSPPRGPMSWVERCRLEELLETGHSPAQAATMLGRHPDTIDREMARGQTVSGYRARVGQDTAEANRKRPKPRHLEDRPALLAEVVARLEQRHSPEQVAGRLREDFPDDPELWVSHETIYQALDVQPRGELARLVKTALRTGRAQRKPQGRKETSGRGKLKGMINISERPAEAKNRAIPGHWESQWCCQAA
jgi:hypothetical protein